MQFPKPTRREFLAASTLAAFPSIAAPARQRVVVLMVDGFGLDYLDRTPMPVLEGWRKKGLFIRGRGIMPSVTNANNASICCGVSPDRHGITGNSFYNERTRREEFMETPDLLMVPTLFQRAKPFGVKSALLSAKKKTVSLLSPGADLLLAAETPTSEAVDRLGPAPDIYSRDINYWLLTAAIDLLKTRRDLGCLYVHTTDYPMHSWPPEARESQEHLARLDQLLGEAAAAAPDAAFLLTADHGVNHKKRCWDLAKACAARGTPIRFAISAEADKYVRHHQGYGGTSWVYCRKGSEIDRVAKIISGLEGVEAVLTRDEAARRLHLMASRIGELVVLGDAGTVFGNLPEEQEALPPEYRSHGSRHELDIPLVIYNAETKLSAEDFGYNRDLARWLYPKR